MEDKNLGETSSPLALMNEHGVISIGIRHTGIRWEGRVVVGHFVVAIHFKITRSTCLSENLLVFCLFSAHSLHHGPEVVPTSRSPALH